jgi:hypothetical protein
MKLVDMKLSAAARDKLIEPSMTSEAPRYPWGLSLQLDDAALKKLGISGKLPDVDAEFDLEAIVCVTNVSSNASSEGGRTRSLALQIKTMGLEKRAAGDKLYKE